MNNNVFLALLLRVLVAAVVVFATYNPTGVSISHWIIAQPNPFDAWVLLVGIVTLLINVSLLIATWKALGALGTSIIVILFAAVAYLFFQEGWVSPESHASIQWLGLGLMSVFLGVGLGGAIVWRRMTGQVVTDESDNVGD